MKFSRTPLSGVVEIIAEPHADDRGSFARVYCANAFRREGLELPDSQSAISRNLRRGTLRGLHFIDEHQGEAKLVRCIRGALFDVAVDLRPGSDTFGAYHAIELSADAANALFLPRGVAHGFMTLTDDCDILYQFSRPHRPGIERGLAWDDPKLAIPWPMTPIVISDRDKALPGLGDLGL